MKKLAQLAVAVHGLGVHPVADLATLLTCKSQLALETRVQPPPGRMNTCPACHPCGAVARESYLHRPNGWCGDFRLSDSGKTRASQMNPLAGSVAPVGHRHIPEICETQNYLAGTGHGLSAAGGDSIVGTITTSAGTANPVAHVRTRGKAPRTVQTSAQAVRLTREKHSGQIPADKVGRVGPKERVHKPVFGNICGVGIGSAVASTLGTAGRTDSIRQKAAPTINRGAVRPVAFCMMRKADSP